MNKSKLYNDDFYKRRNEYTAYSANQILNLVFRYFDIHTAVDIGCGVGTWLNVIKTKGGGVVGLDGKYVNKNYLVIGCDEFIETDLEERIQINQTFDLAISLEVAEHLSKKRAATFVEDLCGLSDTILFSAATILQGGEGHQNEQRLSYWSKMFSERGYYMMDFIRPAIWNDSQIPVWYRQNTVVFAKKRV